MLCVLAYLIGAIPTGKIVAALKGVDIQTIGTGNIGASNTFLAVGKKAGILVLIGDLGKAFIFIYYALFYFSMGEVFFAALFLLLGNIKSIFLKFTGGKGIATGIGIMLATEPLTAFVLAGCWFFAAFFKKYNLLAAIVGIFTIPLTYYILNHGYVALTCALILMLILFVTHRSFFFEISREKPEPDATI
jgi:glycerol-3-phosphate acyltransferase PlsY